LSRTWKRITPNPKKIYYQNLFSTILHIKINLIPQKDKHLLNQPIHIHHHQVNTVNQNSPPSSHLKTILSQPKPNAHTNNDHKFKENEMYCHRLHSNKSSPKACNPIRAALGKIGAQPLFVPSFLNDNMIIIPNRQTNPRQYFHRTYLQ
jgi:hypothetical protein